MYKSALDFYTEHSFGKLNKFADNILKVIKFKFIFGMIWVVSCCTACTTINKGNV